MPRSIKQRLRKLRDKMVDSRNRLNGMKVEVMGKQRLNVTRALEHTLTAINHIDTALNDVWEVD